MNEDSIIKAVAEGDKEAFRELVENYQPLVLNTCYSFLHNTEDAEDVTQEVFIEAYLSIVKFRQNSKLSTWLYRIAVNKSLNFIRDNKKRKILSNFGSFNQSDYLDDREESNPESETEERLKVLHSSIDSLSNKQRVAFTLSKVEDLSYFEIAGIMNVSISSIEGLVHRAKQNVQKKIVKYYQKNPF